MCNVYVLLKLLSALFLSFLHAFKCMCMQPLWQLSGLQSVTMWFESWPEICVVFCLSRCNWLVCELAEKASFHILTCAQFTCILFSIWWYIWLYSVHQEQQVSLCVVFTCMHACMSTPTHDLSQSLTYEICICFCGKCPEYQIQVERFNFPMESTFVVQAAVGLSWKTRWPEQEAEEIWGWCYVYYINTPKLLSNTHASSIYLNIICTICVIQCDSCQIVNFSVLILMPC